MEKYIPFLGLTLSYLIGSVPTAYMAGRILKGIDIRNYGSGNVGATNTFRVLGRMPGIAVLLIDIVKGYIAAGYLAEVFMILSPAHRPELYRIIMGLAAIAGHNWSVFLKFKGGKGVATSAGVVIALIPRIFLIGFLVWLVTFIITGFVSVSSVLAAIAGPVCALVFREPAEIIIFMSVLCLIIAYKHKSNIERLVKGEEKKVNLFKKK